MYNVIKFTLDNIIYNGISDGKEDIKIILPRRLPTITTITSKDRKEKSVIVKPADQIKIKFYLSIETDTIPKLEIVGENGDKSIIKYSTPVNLQAKSSCLLIFTTNDGGTNWLVSFETYKVTPDYPVIVDSITEINGKKGPKVILGAKDIPISTSEPKGPTIIDKFSIIDNSIKDLSNTIVDTKNDIDNLNTKVIKIIEKINIIDKDISEAEIIVSKV